MPQIRVKDLPDVEKAKEYVAAVLRDAGVATTDKECQNGVAKFVRLIDGVYGLGRRYPYVFVQTTRKKFLRAEESHGLITQTAWPRHAHEVLGSPALGLTERGLADAGLMVLALRWTDLAQEVMVTLPVAREDFFAGLPALGRTVTVTEDRATAALMATYLVAGRCSLCHAGSQGQPVTMMRCSRCLRAPYCSRECQVADWPRHKTVCKQLRDARHL